MSKRKAHVETDKQYVERVSKLVFSNDCDPDLTICELQNENKKLLKRIARAEEILHHIDEESNPAYLQTMKVNYFEECIHE